MLSLSVREGDYLMIGENIRVHVQKGLGNHMKLGIEAPKSVHIERGKVYEKHLADDPVGNYREIQANKMKKQDFEKDTERFRRKREGMIAAGERRKG
jgi:carbon storage regulator